jgi:hypothetical protein
LHICPLAEGFHYLSVFSDAGLLLKLAYILLYMRFLKMGRLLA